MNLMHLYTPRRLTALTLAVAVGVLTACEMTSPSMMNTAPIRVEEHQQTSMIKIEDVTQDVAQQIGDDYRHNGQGSVDITVLYIADGSDVLADNDAGRIAGLLRNAGVKDIHVSSLPVGDVRKAGHVMITYTSLQAKAPKGCDAFPADSRDEIVASNNGKFPQYRFGCGVDGYVAAQVARPADLLGDDDIDHAQADRVTGGQVDYRAGKELKELNGLNASELKTN